MPVRFSIASPTSVVRTWLALISLLLTACTLNFAQTPLLRDPSSTQVRIGVFGLFHPHQLTVRPSEGEALILHAGKDSLVLEKSSGVDSATVRISGSGVVVLAGNDVIHASAVTIGDRKNEPVDFLLAIPEKISRRYRGTLEIKPSSKELLAIVIMERETAVASVVAAENTSGTPLEALKAQAIAARSYLVAGRGRHQDFDFCDSTHCQFLRTPPQPGSPASQAVLATRDLVLTYESQAFAAMYTRSCTGRSRRPAELGIPSSTYPYYSVECKYCRAHPVRWERRVSAQDAAKLRSLDESSRLEVDRRLGWAAVSSNEFSVKKSSDGITLEGSGQGHGIGLCQSGAKAMASEGADFRQILSHYYPNTQIVSSTRSAAPH
jgi:stage II sporulation protein D (peptidoglycan lytic transglycosylase)